ncbi:uncharacterized protein LOC143422315 [Xylocopa sonorina]|uniref:uncharacterized protein LOC143422315 n=1 Tax=Xylocopa sonorina TaxID=1818115 RepID=UPI00403ADF14
MDACPVPKFNMPLYESGTTSYFQNYRNKTLSTFSILPYKWAMQSTPYSPKSDVPVNINRCNINRDLNISSNDISTINPIRMKEVDDLFEAVQIHRRQYKDRTSSFHALASLKPDHYKYQCAPRMTTSYLSKYPHNYIGNRIPTVLPLTYERRKQTPYIPDLSLSGTYNESSCIAYKR